MKKLRNDLGILIPLGAGPMVDETAKKIKDRYGINKLKEIAKLNFKNTEKIQ